MRWFIEENKRKISTYDFKNHKDDIEMSGEKVSMIIGYSVDEDNIVSFSREIIFPMFRLQPDVTTSSYKVFNNDNVLNLGDEEFVKAEIDGILSIYTKTDKYNIIHRFYPSTTLPIAYERVEIDCIDININKYERLETKLGCEGYIYAERTATKHIDNNKLIIDFAISARFCNDDIPKETNHFENRKNRINELLNECDLTTGDDVIDTMFAFAKIRCGESIYNTRNGRINSPGGSNYYAGIWANDQCEYSTPWYAFTGDKILNEAAFNAMEWFSRYMNDSYDPMVSSIISEGTDYWNDRGDRGDAEMYLYGNSRLFLTLGIIPDDKHSKMLKWAGEYIEKRIMDTGVVYSDTDELEFRLSSGINLSTSSLAYGAFKMYSILLDRMNKKEESIKYSKLAEAIEEAIENYFGGNVSGFETYHYHKGCDEIRAWITLPSYMGIKKRSKASLDAIDKLLWKNGSCLSTENENISWDISALYYIASLFRCGDIEKAYTKLKELSEIRLLGDRVPYVVEAYPEYNMRHLSAESALYCRIITDGLLNITFNKDGYSVDGVLPKELKSIKLRNIFIDGEYRNIKI